MNTVHNKPSETAAGGAQPSADKIRHGAVVGGVVNAVINGVIQI